MPCNSFLTFHLPCVGRNQEEGVSRRNALSKIAQMICREASTEIQPTVISSQVSTQGSMPGLRGQYRGKVLRRWPMAQCRLEGPGANRRLTGFRGGGLVSLGGGWGHLGGL